MATNNNSKKKSESMFKKLFSKKYFNVSVFILIFAGIAASLVIFSFAAPKNRGGSTVISMYLSPSSQRLRSGQQYTIAIYEDSLNTAVNAVQANLTYDQNLIEVVSVDSSTSPFDIKAETTISNGTIRLGLGHIGNLVGKQLVANVVVKPKASSGKTQINFASGTSLAGAITNTDVLQKTVSGNYSLAR